MDDKLTYQYEQWARQEEINEAVNAYKQELLAFIDAELINCFDPHTDRSDEDQGRFYAFTDMKEFINR